MPCARRSGGSSTTRILPAVTRAALDAEHDDRPEFWAALCEPGWLGLHVDETERRRGLRLRGTGGRARGARPRRRARVRTPRRCSRPRCSRTPAAPRPRSCCPARERRADRRGRARAGRADRSAACSRTSSWPRSTRVAWCALDVGRDGRRSCKSVDPTRRVARASTRRCAAAGRAAARDRRPNGCVEIAAVLLAAEAVGIAQWCVDTAAEYAKVRVQFGRPIGQFQGVKHRCADMLARTELARARRVGRGACRRRRPTTARASRSRRRPRSRSTPRSRTARTACRSLGGIGFTWEHDAHIYLRRAMTLHAARRDRPTRGACARRRARDGRRPPLARCRPARRSRGDARPSCARSSPRSRRSRPPSNAPGSSTPATSRPRGRAPWGRDAGALELLVIEEEFRAAKVVPPGDHGGRVGAART